VKPFLLLVLLFCAISCSAQQQQQWSDIFNIFGGATNEKIGENRRQFGFNQQPSYRPWGSGFLTGFTGGSSLTKQQQQRQQQRQQQQQQFQRPASNYGINRYVSIA
jgi:hypothetical protein